jgi:DNA-binding NtrC family response regulator
MGVFGLACHVVMYQRPLTMHMRPEEDLRLAARVDVPVLVTADSRDHRNLCARLIHDIGVYGGGPFVMFSVDAGDEAAEEAKAVMLRRQFERARGGTLFVDDIAMLPAATQAQLLSLLEERLRHGSAVAPSNAVRVVAGASRHLDAEREAGAFCTPLFYRLNLIHINLIPRHADSQVETSASH